MQADFDECGVISLNIEVCDFIVQSSKFHWPYQVSKKLCLIIKITLTTYTNQHIHLDKYIVQYVASIWEDPHVINFAERPM